MKKKILISVAVVILLLVGALIYLNNRNRTLSPPGSAQLANGSLTVSIQYSRPSVRNRVIFGTKEEGALQPYGEYWRLGANEATEITFNRGVSFNGSEVAGGTYRIYAIPGPDVFEIALNTELGVWGVFKPDHEKDILKTNISVQKLSTPVEQYTVRMEAAGDTTNVFFEWEKVRLMVPIVGK
ncbi:MAG TPA: DUF2911 domain-containing protein [Cyclobacteriaceae bacterium]|nr:DUF2911 domain-containing protein [Cyclobacteriaceae bacterium]HMV09566.1 DUF2911 domain-containing protein [Cyclobacteriaceae bacterium]HMV90492.1 DUF2911 domain-containing protein [Cyclobacteriaceae bacterium]HMX01971.1 DUF2911 domain-containing protein [Cyclobacteriaceae bacterium]HMX51840.1 DUF2911 domain-containing protein [Cyclobacteriaceae bacterium]